MMGFFVFPARNLILESHYGIRFRGCSQSGTDKFDWWDSVDEYGNGTYPSAPGTTDAWSSDYYCSGVQYKDVTATASNLQPKVGVNCKATTCTSALDFDSIFYDSFTGLYLSNYLAPSQYNSTTPCTGASACVDWSEAVSVCNTLDSGDGAGKWRLPTRKEAMLFHIGGIANEQSAKLGRKFVGIESYWTSTTDSANNTYNLYVDVGWDSYEAPKATAYSALICVRSL